MENLPEIWGDIPSALASVPQGKMATADRERFAETLVTLSRGGYWSDVLPKGFGPAEMTMFAASHPVLKSLYKTALSLGNEVRQLKREEAADKRAIEGVDEEVYAANGKFAGTRKRYSDSLLQTQLKAGDPAKYSDSKNAAIAGVVLNVNFGFTREGDNA